MQRLPAVQEEGSGQPSPRQSAVWAEEEPGLALPSHVVPAVPVLLQVLPESARARLRSFAAALQRRTNCDMLTGLFRAASLIPCSPIPSAS